MGAITEHVGSYLIRVTTLDAARGTRPRVVWDSRAAIGYSAGVPEVSAQPIRGSRVHAASISCNDGAANTLVLFKARALTLQANMGGGNLVDGGGGADTITRGAGSFLADGDYGWQVGDRLMPLMCTTPANEAIMQVTAVAAATLTFATGALAGNTSEALPAGAKLLRLAQLGVFPVPANSGFAAGTNAVNLLDDAVLKFLAAKPDSAITLGPDDFLLAAMGTALTGAEVAEIAIDGGAY